MSENVTIFNPKALERIFDLPEARRTADGGYEWDGPYGTWKTKEYQRAGKIMVPWRPGLYRVMNEGNALVWNVPEILSLFLIPITPETTAALQRTMEIVALATDVPMRTMPSDA